VASNLLIFLRINWPQCVKSAAKFGGGASHDLGPPGPSVEPPLPRQYFPVLYNSTRDFTFMMKLLQNRQWQPAWPWCDASAGAAFVLHATTQWRHSLAATISIDMPHYGLFDLSGAMMTTSSIKSKYITLQRRQRMTELQACVTVTYIQRSEICSRPKVVVNDEITYF